MPNLVTLAQFVKPMEMPLAILLMAFLFYFGSICVETLKVVEASTASCHNTQHNDTLHYDTKYNSKNVTRSIITLNIRTLSIVILRTTTLSIRTLEVFNSYAECRTKAQ